MHKMAKPFLSSGKQGQFYSFASSHLSVNSCYMLISFFPYKLHEMEQTIFVLLLLGTFQLCNDKWMNKIRIFHSFQLLNTPKISYYKSLSLKQTINNLTIIKELRQAAESTTLISLLISFFTLTNGMQDLGFAVVYRIQIYKLNHLLGEI